MMTKTPILFRTTDQMRLEGLVAAVTQDGMSLSLISKYDAILDYYGRLLVERLRSAMPTSAVEVYFPANADALINRFNEVLANVSLQDAMAKGGNQSHGTAPKIWVVHDASALPDSEIQLLARLVQNFPAANIRVVMLLPESSQKQKLLSSFGKSVLNWEIEAPTREQAEQMLQHAREYGQESEIRALIQKIADQASASSRSKSIQSGRQNVRQSGAPQALPTSSLEDALLADSAIVAQALAMTADSESAAGPERKGMKAMRLVVIISTLLTVSVLVMAALNREAVMKMWSGSDKTASAKETPPADKPLVASSSPVAPIVANKTALETEVVLSGPETNKVANPEPSAMMQASGSKAADAAIEKAGGGKEEWIAVGPKVNAKNPSDRPEGQTWVQQLPPGSYLAQHATFTSLAQAQQFIRQNEGVKKARVVGIYLPNEADLRFSVVSGPFGTFAKANNFVQSANTPKESLVRSARYMKEQFSAESANAYSKRKPERTR